MDIRPPPGWLVNWEAGIQGEALVWVASVWGPMSYLWTFYHESESAGRGRLQTTRYDASAVRPLKFQNVQ